MSIANDKEHIKNLTNQERFKLFPIILKDYDKAYETRFECEADLIKTSLKDFEITAIHHIGSTAIKGIKSKPTIDMILAVKQGFDALKMEQIMEALGYMNCHAKNELMFVKGYTKDGFKGQVFHVHVRFGNDFDEVKFKNHLNQNKTDALRYEKLKIELSKIHEFDRDEYTHAKTDFILEIMKKIKG